VIAARSSWPEPTDLNPDFLFEVQAFAFMMTETPVFMRL